MTGSKKKDGTGGPVDEFAYNLEHWDEIPARDKSDRLPRGVTNGMFWEAVEDNRARLAHLLPGQYSSWTDDVMCDLAEEALNGVRNWAEYHDRVSLKAFVNGLVPAVVYTWLDRQRPKHRGGMTGTPKRQTDMLRQPVDGDADAMRRWLRAKDAHDRADRFDLGTDVYEAPDQERMHRRPIDCLDYDDWFLGETEQRAEDLESSSWLRECDALFQMLHATFHSRVSLLQAAVGRVATKSDDPRSDSALLRREILTWMTTYRRTQRLPPLDKFPILVATCRKVADNDSSLRRRRRRRTLRDARRAAEAAAERKP